MLHEAAVKKMFFLTIALVCLRASVVSAEQVLLANPTSSPFTSSFDKLVSQNLDRWHTPGLAIAVIRGEETFSKV